MSQKDAPRRTCLRCDNRHGCQDEDPICLTLERDEDESHLSGSELLRKKNLLHRCAQCSQVRRCLQEEDDS